MSRCFLTLALLLQLVGPASVAAAPEPVPDLRSGLQLEGTTWAGDDGSLGFTVYRFLPGGLLEYSYNGRTYRNGTWVNHGTLVYFEANKKYREFSGQLVGSTIAGKSWNVAGARWELTMKRHKSPK